MQVALLQLLAAVYLAILSAGVGFRLDTCPAALICFSVTSIILSLPATILTQSQGACFKMMQVSQLRLQAAVYLAKISACLGFRLEIFRALYDLDTIPRRLFRNDAGGTNAASWAQSIWR